MELVHGANIPFGVLKVAVLAIFALRQFLRDYLPPRGDDGLADLVDVFHNPMDARTAPSRLQNPRLLRDELQSSGEADVGVEVD